MQKSEAHAVNGERERGTTSEANSVSCTWAKTVVAEMRQTAKHTRKTSVNNKLINVSSGGTVKRLYVACARDRQRSH